MPQRVVLIRHAATEEAANGPEGRPLSPDRGAPLSAAGWRQASLLAERLAGLEEGPFLSSPLRRAMETAQTIAGASGRRVEIDPHLREIEFGDWAGLTFAEMARRDPGRVAGWSRFDRDFAFPGGERLGDFLDRIGAVARRVAARGGTVVLVTHGGVIRALICRLLDLDSRHFLAFGVDHASVSEVDLFGETGVLVRLNDTCHLGGR